MAEPHALPVDDEVRRGDVNSETVAVLVADVQCDLLAAALDESVAMDVRVASGFVRDGSRETVKDGLGEIETLERPESVDEGEPLIDAVTLADLDANEEAAADKDIEGDCDCDAEPVREGELEGEREARTLIEDEDDRLAVPDGVVEGDRIEAVALGLVTPLRVKLGEIEGLTVTEGVREPVAEMAPEDEIFDETELVAVTVTVNEPDGLVVLDRELPLAVGTVVKELEDVTLLDPVCARVVLTVVVIVAKLDTVKHPLDDARLDDVSKPLVDARAESVACNDSVAASVAVGEIVGVSVAIEGEALPDVVESHVEETVCVPVAVVEGEPLTERVAEVVAEDDGDVDCETVTVTAALSVPTMSLRVFDGVADMLGETVAEPPVGVPVTLSEAVKVTRAVDEVTGVPVDELVVVPAAILALIMALGERLFESVTVPLPEAVQKMLGDSIAVVEILPRVVLDGWIESVGSADEVVVVIPVTEVLGEGLDDITPLSVGNSVPLTVPERESNLDDQLGARDAEGGAVTEAMTLTDPLFDGESVDGRDADAVVELLPPTTLGEGVAVATIDSVVLADIDKADDGVTDVDVETEGVRVMTPLVVDEIDVVLVTIGEAVGNTLAVAEGTPEDDARAEGESVNVTVVVDEADEEGEGVVVGDIVVCDDAEGDPESDGAPLGVKVTESEIVGVGEKVS